MSCCDKKRPAEKQYDSCCSTKTSESPNSENKKVNLPKIHRQMTIEEILGSYPHKAQKLAQELTQAGLHCVGCQAATWETLEAGMLGHGMSEEMIEELVRRLNAVLEEESDPNTITMTKRAAKKFLEILAEEGKQGWSLRFGDRMSGCSGFEYLLDYSEKATEDDSVYTSQGIEIHVHKSSVNRLLGSEIDFVDGLQGSGFKISNPNARSSCGCGSSHGY
jgi:iron-sulfur cluster assembly accessory protein